MSDKETRDWWRETVLAVIDDKPKMLRDVMSAHAASVGAADVAKHINIEYPNTMGSYSRWKYERAIDRSLQWLKKKGHIRLLKKADGGPGWVRAGNP